MDGDVVVVRNGTAVAMYRYVVFAGVCVLIPLHIGWCGGGFVLVFLRVEVLRGVVTRIYAEIVMGEEPMVEHNRLKVIANHGFPVENEVIRADLDGLAEHFVENPVAVA